MEITSFSGYYRFLSNFYPSPINLNDLTYPTLEHTYQAAKTLDKQQIIQIWNAKSPGEAKRLGKNVTLRQDWNLIRDNLMLDLLRIKFNKYLDLKQKLLDTGDWILIEGNTWNDTYWGQCPIGNGENKLGKFLMQVREELKCQ